AHHRLSPARLGHLAPALLGLSDPGHSLRQMRHRAGAGSATAGDLARGCELRPAGQPAGASSDVEAYDLPEMRRQGRARDRHLRYVLRIVVVLRALLL